MDDGAVLSDRQVRTIARRTLLASGMGGMAGAWVGCSPRPAGVAIDPVSMAALTSKVPFVVGSRGGAQDWPEMTVFGFEQAAAIPEILAMELLVARTADGVLVCSADLTTKRMTGRDLVIADEDWATLSGLTVHGRDTSEPAQPVRPFARLDDILDRFSERFVIFVEPVSKATVVNLLPKLISLNAPGRIVWKQPITSRRFAEAKLHGFTTYGYVLDEPAHTGAGLRGYVASDTIDIIGASITKPRISTTVLELAERFDKVPIAWNVRSGKQLGRAVTLGFTGVSSPAVRDMAALVQ